MTEMLVGTKKGLFVLEGDPAGGFEVAARAFPGQSVEYAMRDPRTGRYFASVTSWFYGPRIWVTDDPTGEWEQARARRCPRRRRRRLERIWVIVPGEEDGVLYAGGDPGRALREPRRRPHMGAEPRPLGPPDAAGLEPRRRRALPPHDRHRGPATRRGSWWRSRPSACGSPTTRRRRGATRTAASCSATCRRRRVQRRPRAAALRPQRPPRAAATGAAVHAVPRRGLPLRRRRRDWVDIGTARACRPISASRSPSTPPIPTAPT